MEKRKQMFWLITFSFFSVIFLLLLSYKAVIHFTDLTPNQQGTIEYLQNKNMQLTLNYTLLEQSHLTDVKQIMRFSDYCFYFSLLVLTLIITYHRQMLIKLFLSGGISTAAVSLLIIICSQINFGQLFAWFHQFFFPQGNWIFSSSSLLIQTFPLEFFVKSGTSIFLLTLTEGIVFIVLTLYLKHAISD